MDVIAVALPTLDGLNEFVRLKLCELDRLDPGQTPFYAMPIERRGRPCGGIFHIEGPRLLRTSAVWAGDEHRILFYDSVGNRVAEVRLSESPEMNEQKSSTAA